MLRVWSPPSSLSENCEFLSSSLDSTTFQRHEYYLGGRLGVNPGAKVLDCGCGIGGPYRNIAKFTGADITGITINEYQVWERARGSFSLPRLSRFISLCLYPAEVVGC